MSPQENSVLVTGAGGLIASHLAETLVQCGAKVRAKVHYHRDRGWAWLDHSTLRDEMDVVAGDVTDADSVHDAMGGCAKVLHLAALVAIPYSCIAPYSYVRTNAEGTVNTLQAARKLGVDRVVHISASEVYGTARYVPINENHPMQGQSPHSASKISAGKMTESFCNSFGLPVVTVPQFKTYGRGQLARAVIPTIVKQCLNGETTKLGNQTPTRDFNFVAETVSGIISAGDIRGVEGITTNRGAGREISMVDFVRLIAQLIGRSIKLMTDCVRTRPKDGEVERLLASNELARANLCPSPAMPPEEGAKQTISWIERNQHRYRTSVYAI